jgi:hypothetical protein
MTKLKLLAAAAVLSIATATTAMAEQPYHHVRHYHHGPVGAALGVAGAAVGTAAAIATAPFRDSYAFDNGNARERDPNGFVCHRGTWFKADDGSRHMCQ